MDQHISIVINTYNASKFLEPTLEKLTGFDEIVVCDMESTDNTCEIAEKYGCKIVTFHKGNYNICEVARDFAIHSARYEWVLVVDADEIVSKELHDYLYEFIKNPEGICGLYIPRQNLTMGVALPASYPDYQLRFFRQSKTVWPPVIHCKPEIEGKVSYIPRNRRELAFLHLDDSTSGDLRKMNTYTDNEISRRPLKHVTLAKLIFSPMMRFLKMYFLKRGFLHGKAGYIQATRQSMYKFTLLCKMYEKELANRHSTQVRV